MHLDPIGAIEPKRPGAARRGRLLAAVVLTAALAAAPGAAEAEPANETPEESELEDLSLDELLSLRLGGMRITEIHHTHDAGEFMAGYSYMYMDMDGNRDGTSRASTSEVFADGFMVAPTSMSMQMHMVHLMYAPTDLMTFGMMVPILQKSMEHLVNPAAPVPFAGTKFTARSSGPGDITVHALVSLYQDEGDRLLADLGWSFPVGSIDEKDRVPMSATRVRLPYPMQLGSGTFDARPGLTYLGQSDRWTWGANANGIVRVGENSNDYTLGDEWAVTAWGARGLTDWLSGSVRLQGRGWGDIDGADPQLNAAMVPTADPKLRAGERLDMLFGLNLFAVDGPLGGNRLSLEGGLPVYQRLDGPQLETDWRISVAWDWAFDTPFGFGR